jgi:(R,R)-butanediol dehydrogenase/meso-butanediol dehydrogenase/diacetyl reductase
MKAAVLVDPHNMVIDDIPEPVAGSGEVVLKVGCCGICGTDLQMYRIGSYTARAILGHECSGVIEVVGPGVEDWAVGDRVVVDDVFPCGTCDFCSRGRERLCQNVTTLGSQWPGAYAEYTKVPATSLFRLPDNVSMEAGALVQVLAVGHHVVERASVEPGAKTLVIGAGPIGLSVQVALKMAGFEDVAVVAKHPSGKKAAEALGASAVVDSASQDVLSEFESIFSSAPQLVIECAGKADTVLQSLQMVEKEGTVVIVGNCFEETSLLPITWVLKEINIKGSDGATKEGFRAALGWLAEEKVDPSIFLTRVITLDELPQTMEKISTHKDDIKVAVAF